MKTITLFLLISVLVASAWALTNARTDLETLSQDNAYIFNNLKDDDMYDGWEGINVEEHMHSIAEFPEEECLEQAKVPKSYDDLDETELLSILLQILNDSPYHKEITEYLEKFSNKKLKTKEGYIDLFDLLIFGSLKSKRLYSAEEESNEEGMLHTMVEMKNDWATANEENIEDYSVDDQAFIDLIMSKKELDGEFIIDMVLSLMKKRGNNDVDDDDEEEEDFDQKEDVAVVVVNSDESAVADYEVPQHLRPMAKRELDQVFGVAFDF